MHAKRFIGRFERWRNLDPDPTVENGDPVIIDYEDVYPKDLFDRHYVNSFQIFYEHNLSSSKTKRVMDENSRARRLR